MAEEELLKKMWDNMSLSMDNIEQILNRSRPSIDAKRRNLGLPLRTNLRSQWEFEEKLRRYKEVVEG